MVKGKIIDISIIFIFFISLVLFSASTIFNPKLKNNIVETSDLHFLEELTADVLQSSRIQPGEIISPAFGPNNTGGTLIRPGGKDCYPSFWIRDYAMSLESGLIPVDEQKHMLLLTASTQCVNSWITKWGTMIPIGAIADHIRIDDSLPIYFPGTYSYSDQGNPKWGILPPICDQFFFIHMAYWYIKESSDFTILHKIINGISLLDRLKIAYNVPSTRGDSPIIYTTENFRSVDFGFRDAVVITGDLCFPSILKYQASKELAWLLNKVNMNEEANNYLQIANRLKKEIREIFYTQKGMLLASTGKSHQPDVWGTALAVYLGILEGNKLKRTCDILTTAYLEGTLSYKGNIRHILTVDDYSDSTAWEVSSAKLNTYQNGAYWGTPTGWVVYAISKSNPQIAARLVKEYINELRENDYRKGEKFGAPYECIQPSGEIQNSIYLTSVTCPYAVFKQLAQQNY